MFSRFKNWVKLKFLSTGNEISGKISYSQCGEDLIVEFLFNQLKIYKPTYLDIGAHHPDYLSNTALFYQKGCRGINVEPDPELIKKFKNDRKEDINLNIGVGVKEDLIDFFIMNVPTLNTFANEQVELYKKEGDYFIKEIKKIKVDTVYNILKHNDGIFPDFLSLDAEGVDEIVIRSIDFQNRPKVICVETISFSESRKGIKNHSLINFLEEKGYMLYADTYINSIFVSKEIWGTN